jgi:hypothetical protein
MIMTLLPGMRRRSCRQITPRIGDKLLAAPVGAKEKLAATVLRSMRQSLGDGHTAHWIDCAANAGRIHKPSLI